MRSYRATFRNDQNRVNSSNSNGTHQTLGVVLSSKHFRQNFNHMIDSLRVSYEGLEEKVAIRTDELYQQKVLVEHKNQEIVDSINYARFIQQVDTSFCTLK